MIHAEHAIPAIAVVTATYNSSQLISRLIDSLVSQSTSNFEWVVQDGGSTDGTQDLLAGVVDFVDVRMVSERDGGIYDALNRAIRRVRAPYYVVVGSDDWLYPHALETFIAAFARNSTAMIVTGSVDTPAGQLRPGLGQSWMRGQNAYISNHSVGMACRVDLHKSFGYYSRALPIAADQLLVKRVAGSRPDAVVKVPDVIGYFGGDGVSSTDIVGLLCECYRVQLETEPSPVFQTFLFILKLLNNLGAVRRAAVGRR